MKKTSFMLLMFVSLYLSCTLNRGIPVIQEINNSDPTVSFRLVFHTGSAFDPRGKEGLAYMTARMLTDAGTQMHSQAEINDLLYPMAAGYYSQVDKEYTTILGRTHLDNLKDYYQLLKEAILYPGFSQDDLDRIKTETLNYLKSTLRYASDEELGKAALYQFVFEGTPYAHPVRGLVKSVESITLDDVRQFYATQFTQANLLIGVGGSVPADLVSTMQNDFATLPMGKENELPDIEVEIIRGHQVYLIDKPGANSTAISIGFPLPLLRGSREWYALDVARSWLGEHRNSSSHLYQVVREIRGLNYGDYAYIEHFPNGGRRQFPPANIVRHHQLFEIWIRPVPNDAKHFALRAAIRELNHLVQNGLTKEQFELTRQFLKNYILHYAPTTSMKLGYKLDDHLYGLRQPHLEAYRKILDELTVEDVNKAIKKYLQVKNLKIAMVTDQVNKLIPALVNNEPSSIKYDQKKPASVYKEDALISTYPLHVRTESIRTVKVNKLFD